MEFAALEAVYKKWMYLDADPLLLRMMYASVLANRYPGVPVWSIIIGSAGCGKSELLMSLSRSEEVYTVSSLTPKSLASGYGSGDQSLIYKLNRKVLVVKDMSSVTEMYAEAFAELMSILRDAYDGKMERATGRNEVRWEGKFGFLGGSTVAIEKARKMDAMLGERFLYIRMNAVNSAELLRAVTNNSMKKPEMQKELQEAAVKFLKEFKTPPGRTIPADLLNKIQTGAQILARGRSSISRDWSKDIDFPAESGEVGSRVYSQILLLILAARSLGTSDTDLEQIVYRLVIDGLPYIRMRTLRVLNNGARNGYDVSKQIHLSKSVSDRYLQDMEFLDLIEETYPSSHEFLIKDKFLIEAIERTKR